MFYLQEHKVQAEVKSNTFCENSTFKQRFSCCIQRWLNHVVCFSKSALDNEIFTSTGYSKNTEAELWAGFVCNSQKQNIFTYSINFSSLLLFLMFQFSLYLLDFPSFRLHIVDLLWNTWLIFQACRSETNVQLDIISTDNLHWQEQYTSLIIHVVCREPAMTLQVHVSLRGRQKQYCLLWIRK